MGHNEGLEVLLAQGSKGHAFQLAAQLEGGGPPVLRRPWKR